MSDIASFIKARLAEDAEQSRWLSDSWWLDVYRQETADAVRHFAEEDRVLRAVEAKRAIVDLYTSAVEGHQTAVADYDKTGSLSDSHEVIKADVRRQTYLDALTALASEWATHQDYRKEEWEL